MAKQIYLHITLLAFPFISVNARTAGSSAHSDVVTILHTNDTHSQIDPDSHNGLGGVVRRKAAIDSVRNVMPNVLVVDAGDAVQGSPYYTLFKGVVEQGSLDRMGYDVQILGNHEFDDGLRQLAGNYKGIRASVISANNIFSGTPVENIVTPYIIKETGGKRIGFIGININPRGLIDGKKSEGVVYTDAVEAMNRYATYLKNEAKTDAVVVVSHIGYTKSGDDSGYTDPQLARASRNVDVIIGGHSHTPLVPGSPETMLTNADGKPILVVQNGGKGYYLGQVNLTFAPGGEVSADWNRILIDRRLDSDVDPQFQAYVSTYSNTVDSIMNSKAGEVSADFGADAMLNFASDFVMELGTRLNNGRRPDLAIMNKGGIRHRFDRGNLSTGQIMSTFPFDNRVVIIDMTGDQLIKLFDILALQRGNGISRNAQAVMDSDFTKCISVSIDGKPIDPERTYRIATIDYLYNGGDRMYPLSTGIKVAESDAVLYEDMFREFKNGIYAGKTLQPDNTPRMTTEK